jgi:uncharacterized protein (TIGR00255 family)
MLASMTGYGKAECEMPGRRITIEIKSLNSKQLDISTRLPSFLRDREIDIRNEISRELERGKIECYVSAEIILEEIAQKINKEIVKNYIKQLREINDELNLKNEDQLIQVAMRLPDALKPDKDELESQEWDKILESLHTAVTDVKTFRLREGRILEDDMKKRIYLIIEKLDKIKSFEEGRILSIRNHMTQSLKDLKLTESYDPNRFEQELIYWIERLDITEEKVRLLSHCNYFLEVMQSINSTGKKLSFISQEIGRELNTLGAKSNDSDIQKLIVEMKDELEKIKEQLNNIL